jgi:hypothetical protein
MDLVIWLVIAVAGFLGYFLGTTLKLGHLFVLGCALLVVSGSLLWVGDGLVLGRELTEVTDAGELVYVNQTIGTDNVGLSALSVVLISVGVLSFLIMDFGGAMPVRSKAFHY